MVTVHVARSCGNGGLLAQYKMPCPILHVIIFKQFRLVETFNLIKNMLAGILELFTTSDGNLIVLADN